MIRSRMFALSLSLNVLVAGIVLIGWVAPNVKTTFNPEVDVPIIAKTARIHPLAVVSGSAIIGEHVFVAPGASIRGDEGEHIFIGDSSNVQDGVVVHGLETFEGGHELIENEVEVEGQKYSVHIGKRVSLSPSVPGPRSCQSWRRYLRRDAVLRVQD